MGKDFYRPLGWFAAESLFIHTRYEADGVVEVGQASPRFL
jgi:hypothetical protein